MRAYHAVLFIVAIQCASLIQNVSARRAFYDEDEVFHSAENYFKEEPQEDGNINLPPSRPQPPRPIKKLEIHRDYDHDIKFDDKYNKNPAHTVQSEEAQNTEPLFKPLAEKITNKPQPIRLPPPLVATSTFLPLAGADQDDPESDENEDIVGIFSLEQVKPGSKLRVVFRPRPKSVASPASSVSSTGTRRNTNNPKNGGTKVENGHSQAQKKPQTSLSTSNRKFKKQEEVDPDSDPEEDQEVHIHQSQSQPKKNSNRIQYYVDSGDEDENEEDEDLITTDQDPQFNGRGRRPRPQPRTTTTVPSELARKRPSSRYPSTSTTTTHKPIIATRRPSLFQPIRNKYNEEEQEETYYEDENTSEEVTEGKVKTPTTTLRSSRYRPHTYQNDVPPPPNKSKHTTDKNISRNQKKTPDQKEGRRTNYEDDYDEGEEKNENIFRKTSQERVWRKSEEEQSKEEVKRTKPTPSTRTPVTSDAPHSHPHKGRPHSSRRNSGKSNPSRPSTSTSTEEGYAYPKKTHQFSHDRDEK